MGWIGVGCKCDGGFVVCCVVGMECVIGVVDYDCVLLLCIIVLYFGDGVVFVDW